MIWLCFWDYLINGVEEELLDRHGSIGNQREKYVGGAGKHEVAWATRCDLPHISNSHALDQNSQRTAQRPDGLDKWHVSEQCYSPTCPG